MTRGVAAGLMGSAIAVGLSGAVFVPTLALVVIYPLFPGLEMMVLLAWVTHLNFGANEVVLRVWVTVMNAAFYGAVSYAVMYLAATLRLVRREP